MTAAARGRLLIVDDEAELLAALSESLTEQGYEVEGFTLPNSALQALQRSNFDLLLTDLMMPEMDGIELVQAAQEIDPDLVSIIMTGQGTVQTAVGAMKIGAHDYILKPFKLQAVLGVLERAMQLRQLRLKNVQLQETVAIYELTKTLARTLDLATILQQVVSSVQQLEVDEISIMLLTPDGQELYVAIAEGAQRAQIVGQRMPLEQGVGGWVARHQEPLTLHGEVKDEPFAPLHPRPEIASAVSLPMLAGGKLVGVLNVNATRRRRPYSPGEVKAFSILASTAAAAIEAATLYQQVQASEARYRSIFENAVEGMFRRTREGYNAVNPAMARIHGYASPQDFIDNAPDTAQLFVDPQQFTQFQRLLTEQDVVAGFETEVYRKDGSVIWVSVNMRAVRDEAGTLLYREGSLEDITERRQAALVEQQLRQFAQATLNSLSSHIAVLDEHGVVIAVNEAWQRFAADNDGVLERCGIGANYLTVCDNASGSWATQATTVAQGIREIIARQRGAFELEYPCHSSSQHRWFNLRVTSFDGTGTLHIVVAHEDISERKLAETAMAESAQRFATIFHASPIATSLTTADEGKYIDVNAAWLRLFGYAREEVFGQTAQELDIWADTAQRSDFMQRLRMHGPGYRSERAFRTKVGEIRHAINYVELLELDGTECVLHMTYDDTARQQAEAALREREEFQRTLLENFPNGSVNVFDRDLRYVMAAGRGLEMRGLDAAQLIGKPLHEVFPPEQVAVTQPYYEQVLAGSPARFELRLDAYYYDINAVPLHDATGTVSSIMVVAQDITERKQAAVESEKAAQRFAKIFHNSPLPVSISTRDEGRFIDANESFVRVYGYTRDELVGHTSVELNMWPDAGLRPRLFQILEERGSIVSEEVSFRVKSGELRDMLASIEPIEVDEQSCVLMLTHDITDRKRVEQELQRSEAQLAEAQRVARIGSWEWDVESGHSVWSDEMYRLFGLPIGASFTSPEQLMQCQHPDDRALVENALAQALADGQPFEYFNRIRRRDGIERILHSRGAVVTNESGQLLRVYGTSQDVTELKQAEAALQRANAELESRVAQRTQELISVNEELQSSNEQLQQTVAEREAAEAQIKHSMSLLQATLESTADGILVANNEDKILNFNQRFVEMWRVPAELMRLNDNQQLIEYVQEQLQDPTAFVQQVDQLHSARDRESHDVLEFKDGRVFERYAVPQRLDGRGVGRVLSFRDVTQRYQTEQELRDRARQQAVVAELGQYALSGRALDDLMERAVALVRDTLNGEFIGLLELTGDNESLIMRAQAGWTTKKVGQFVTANRADTLAGYVIRAGAPVLIDDARTESRFNISSTIREQGIISGLSVCIHTETKPFGVLGVFCANHRVFTSNDANFMQALANVLATAIEHKQAQEAILLARTEAERANAAKSEFLSRMSHELRTPLNAILGFGQILDRQDITPLAKESVSYILNGGRHLLDLINEVLDIARVEAGHLELSLEPVALDDIMPEACALVRPLAAERAIRLETNIAQLSGHYILADRQRLKQVLINLISNAIKYNREGGQVEVRCDLHPGGRIAIAVRDTGPGIAPDDLTKLFTPFERLNAGASQIEGTGLGLVLSQRLMTAMGGTLTAASTLGQGSTFTVELPQATSPTARLPEVLEGIHQVDSNQVAEHVYTVLCIEDNPSNLRLLEAIFQDRLDIRLLAAMQGSVGLDLARQHEPDLILLDLNLPDMHGKDVLTRLQQSALTRDIPVVIITADATPHQIERLLSAGAGAYLTKPLDVNEFLATVNRFLQVTPPKPSDKSKEVV